MFSYAGVDLRLLKSSAFAFALAFIPPVLAEALLGSYNFFVFIWIMVPVAFHEIGHLFFRFFVSAPLSAILPLSYLAEPMHYLGGFLFNATAAIVLLWFSLLVFSRIQSGKLPEENKPVAFSIMFIAYLNLFMLPYTLTHLAHVVGKGLDFTMASFLLNISLEQLLGMLWIVCAGAIVLAILINAFFALKKGASQD